jgi:hypothetical protein
MANRYPGANNDITVASLQSPSINALGGGTVSATYIRAGSISVDTFSFDNIDANNVTANTTTTRVLAGIDGFEANTITLYKQIVLTATASGLVTTPAPFVPIKHSGIRDIVVQGQGIAFNGTTFPGIGTYSYLLANVDAFMNKNDPNASQILDIQYAYCNDPSGNVLYSFDMVILYPTDSSKYSGFMAVEGANRGSSRMCYMEDVAQADLYSNTVPSISSIGVSTAGTGSGNKFKYLQGDMIVCLGWETGRSQSLSNAMVSLYPNNVISSTNKWPGQAAATALGIVPASFIGIGATLPVCYSDALNVANVITGTCIDRGYFPFSNTGTYGTASNVNSLFMNYPYYPDSPYTLTLAFNSGTTVQVDANLFTVVNGYGTVGGISTEYSGCSGIVTPATCNPAYVMIDRNSVMKGTDGTPMHTSKPECYTEFAAVLQADASGFLRDYGSEYAITYTGIGTTPALLGQLGIRDVVSYLRYGTGSLFLGDSSGFWSGYSGNTSNAMLYGFEQSSDLARGFLWNGFNVDSVSRPVFDGCIVSQSMGTRKGDRYRFTKSCSSFEHFDPYGRSNSFFPFAYQTLTDPVSGVTDGILMKYANYSNCVPKVYHAMSSHELFTSRGSLLVTDSLGKALTKLQNTEFFLVTGAPHAMTFSYTNADLASSTAPPVEGVSQGVPRGAESYVYRSMYYNMKTWLTSGSPTSPLLSRFPSVGQLQIDTSGGFPGANRYFSNGSTLQRVQSTANKMNWPDLSSLGLPWNGTQYYSAPFVVFPQNINTNYPSSPGHIQYTVLLPFTDSSGVGNDIGGIPTPEMTAPLFTSRGYNTYIQGYDTNDLVYLGSSAIPLSSNVSTLSLNDTRPTINSLYGNCVTWSNAWSAAVANNITNGWMLPSGVFAYDSTCYANRGTYQAYLLNTVYGLPST